MSNGRFGIPCQVVGGGYIKTMSREALLLMVTSSYTREHDIDSPVDVMSSLTGLSASELDNAKSELHEVVDSLNLGVDLKQQVDVLHDIIGIFPDMELHIESLISRLQDAYKNGEVWYEEN